MIEKIIVSLLGIALASFVGLLICVFLAGGLKIDVPDIVPVSLVTVMGLSVITGVAVIIIDEFRD